MGVACIIPIHGRTELLERCLQSITAQTCEPQELVIVSDHNTATDHEHIIQIASQFPTTRVIENYGVVGAAAARNVGILATTAPLIFFADADLVFRPRAFEILVEALRNHPAADIAFGDFLFNSHHMRGQAFSLSALRAGNYISTMSLVRRAAFPGFDESLKRFQDWDAWLTMAERGAQGIYVPEILFEGTAGGSMSSWIPSFMVRHARWFLWIPRVRAYAAARDIIARKHHLTVDDHA